MTLAIVALLHASPYGVMSDDIGDRGPATCFFIRSHVW